MKVNGTDLAMVRGDSEAIWVKVVDADGVLVPLVAGDKVYFTVKDDAYTEVKRLQKVITEFDEGRAFIGIEPQDTKGLEFGKYMYDVQVTFADNTVKTVVRPSLFVVAEEVTYE